MTAGQMAKKLTNNRPITEMLILQLTFLERLTNTRQKGFALDIRYKYIEK